MNHRKPGHWLAAMLLSGAILLSACQQSVSNAPVATATQITPTGLFVTPLSGENPMQMIEQFAQGTAAAQTAAAGGGTPTTPQAVSTLETEIIETGTAPTNIVAATTPVVGTEVTTIATTPVLGTQIVGTLVTSIATTPVIAGTIPTMGPRPASYTLQKGEFPYCIARRFNVDPAELLNINGLVDGELYYPNLTLKIPQTGNPFPASRALHAHPTTYTVPSSTTTVYGVACYFGDIDPAAVAAANAISVAAALTTGQQLAIP
ncbi:MAG: LysM peptidoglycan-binding domain-containing protein [Bacteroidota bacterium]